MIIAEVIVFLAGIFMFAVFSGLMRIVGPAICLILLILLIVLNSSEKFGTKKVSSNLYRPNSDIDEIARKFIESNMYAELIAGIRNSGAYRRIEISHYGVSCDNKKYIYAFNAHGYDKLSSQAEIKALGRAILHGLPNNHTYTAYAIVFRGLFKRKNVDTFKYTIQTEYYNKMRWNEHTKCWEDYKSVYDSV